MVNPRRIPRLLQIHPKIDDVHDHLDVAKRLKGPSHHPKTEEWLPLPGDECGNDGVKGTLAWGVCVVVPLFEGVGGSSIMKDKPHPIGDDPGSKGGSDALDEGDHIPFPICYRQIDRISLLERGVAGTIIDTSLGIGDQLPSLFGIGLRNQVLNRQAVEGGIGIELRTIFISQFLGLDKVVQMLPAPEAKFSQIVRLEKVEHLENRDPLPVRGKLPDIIAPVVGRDRVDPV